jgi:site-specific DNA-methyltransferase (adenine-specific)
MAIELYNEDNMKLMERYPDKYFDIAIVDPPYGIDINNQSQGKGGGVAKKIDYTKYDWDKQAPDKAYFDELMRVSKNQIIWGGNYFPLPPTRCFIVWDKQISEDFSLAMAELAWTSFDKLAKIFKMPTPKDGKIHPTQKPIQLYRWLLHNYTNENDLILDTHLGSGSIAIACHQMKRKLIGYEIDADYYRKACKRFEEQTRQTALW